MFGHTKKVPKILIVEDREANHALYREVFGKAGFEVSIIKKVDSSFLETVCQLTPDIIAMDLMIESDVTEQPYAGFDLVFLLKEDKRTAHIPVMILTVFFEESKVAKAKELGAVDFINVSGYKVQQLPEIFLRYLDNPKNYRPAHPMFRSV
jgi:CheY-like chemotaxis protein